MQEHWENNTSETDVCSTLEFIESTIMIMIDEVHIAGHIDSCISKAQAVKLKH